MLRKKLAVLVAAALMSLTASSAFAAFADLELIRVYYDRTGAEIATDLGNVKSLLSDAQAATPAGLTLGGSFTGSTGTVGSTGFAVYFALDRATNQFWATGSTTTPSIEVGSATGLNSFKSGSTSVYNYYNSIAVGNTAATTAGNLSSYKTKLSATQGTLAVSISNGSRLNTELSLANLATNNIQALYFFKSGVATLAADKIGESVATITTNADGSTTINTPVATPIPAAFYLMGSGLMGLVGLRRRNKVA